MGRRFYAGFLVFLVLVGSLILLVGLNWRVTRLSNAVNLKLLLLSDSGDSVNYRSVDLLKRLLDWWKMPYDEFDLATNSLSRSTLVDSEGNLLYSAVVIAQHYLVSQKFTDSIEDDLIWFVREKGGGLICFDPFVYDSSKDTPWYSGIRASKLAEVFDFSVLSTGEGTGEPVYSRDWNDGSAHAEDWDIYNAILSNPADYLRITWDTVRHAYITHKTLSLQDLKITLRYRLVSSDYNNHGGGIAFRMDPSDPSRNCYALYQLWGNGDFVLVKYVNSDNYVILAQVSGYSVNTWYNLEIKVIGNSIKVWIDGELKIDVTDESFQYGKVGVRGYSYTCDIDDLNIYNEGTAGYVDLKSMDIATTDHFITALKSYKPQGTYSSLSWSKTVTDEEHTFQAVSYTHLTLPTTERV